MINDIDNKNSNIGILFPDKIIPNANIENNIGIKYLRSDEIQHNSMLIHISRFVSVQNTVIKQIKSYVKDLKNVISNEIDKEKNCTTYFFQ